MRSKQSINTVHVILRARLDWQLISDLRTWGIIYRTKKAAEKYQQVYLGITSRSPV